MKRALFNASNYMFIGISLTGMFKCQELRLMGIRRVVVVPGPRQQSERSPQRATHRLTHSIDRCPPARHL